MDASVDVDALLDLGYSVGHSATLNVCYRWWLVASPVDGGPSSLELGGASFPMKADAWAAAKAHSDLVLARKGGDPSAGTEEKRLPRAEVERIVEALLEKEAPGYPRYTLLEVDATGWKFWVSPEDPISYVLRDGSIQWNGSQWPEQVTYDGETGWFVLKPQPHHGGLCTC